MVVKRLGNNGLGEQGGWRVSSLRVYPIDVVVENKMSAMYILLVYDTAKASVTICARDCRPGSTAARF